MKTKIFLSLLTFCIVLGFINKVQSSNLSEGKQRLYLESGNIQIANNDFFLNLGNEFLPISSIGRDEKGAYILLSVRSQCGSLS